MNKYMILITINENNKFWIVVDRGRFIRKPTDKDMKGATLIAYSKTNICPRCRKEKNITDRSILYPGNMLTIRTKNTEEKVCGSHYRRRFSYYEKNENISTIELVDNMDVKSGKYCKKELLEYLRKFKKEEGKIPTASDFYTNQNYPDANIYQRVFKSWNNALKMAGLSLNQFKGFTNEELLEFLSDFYKENGRPPAIIDFYKNPKYPSFATYVNRFGSWENAKRIIGIDIDTMIRNGFLKSSTYKARLFEIFVLEHFKNEAIDLSGEDPNSYADGICPNGMLYDAKSSTLIKDKYYLFHTNKEISHYYLGGFNKHYTELDHVWRIPGNFIHDKDLYISIDNTYKYNIKNMIDYEITQEFIEIFDNWIENIKRSYKIEYHVTNE